MDNTLTVFLEDDLTDKFSKLILTNLIEQQHDRIGFNLTQIEFNFEKKQAVISYFVVDDEYPDVELSFDELLKKLNGELTKGNSDKFWQ